MSRMSASFFFCLSHSHDTQSKSCSSRIDLDLHLLKYNLVSFFSLSLSLSITHTHTHTTTHNHTHTHTHTDKCRFGVSPQRHGAQTDSQWKALEHRNPREVFDQTHKTKPFLETPAIPETWLTKTRTHCTKSRPHLLGFCNTKHTAAKQPAQHPKEAGSSS